MQRFFLSEGNRKHNTIIIDDVSLVHQISHVMRSKKGDTVIALFNDGFEHTIEIQIITKKKIEGNIIETMKNTNELPYTLSLIQSLPKSKDIWESIIKKSTELGVSHIIPFTSSRTTSKFSVTSTRIDTIKKEAAEQSERGVLPTIHKTKSYKEILQHIEQEQRSTQVFIADSFNAKNTPLLFQALSSKKTSSSSIIIGPEGGFSEKEIQDFSNAGAKPISLGSLILRVETAAVSSVGIIAQYMCR